MRRKEQKGSVQGCIENACVTGALCYRKHYETLGFVFILALASPAFGQPAPADDRVSKQNALFEEFYQTGLKNSPERANVVWRLPL